MAYKYAGLGKSDVCASSFFIQNKTWLLVTRAVSSMQTLTFSDLTFLPGCRLTCSGLASNRISAARQTSHLMNLMSIMLAFRAGRLSTGTAYVPQDLLQQCLSGLHGCCEVRRPDGVPGGGIRAGRLVGDMQAFDPYACMTCQLR